MSDWMNDPRLLNSVGSDVEAGGAIAGALSHLDYGLQAQKAMQFQAAQLRINAGQQMASSQRQAFDVQRESDYIASRALAVAAASGGGASDPTVVNLMARNAAEMAYRKSVALYQGENAAREMNMAADAKEYEGANLRRNATEVAASQVLGAGTSLLRGYARDASLRQRFGGDGPDLSGVT